MSLQEAEAHSGLSKAAKQGQDVLEDIVLAIEYHVGVIPYHDREALRYIQYHALDKQVRWEYKGVSMVLGTGTLKILTGDWHLSILTDWSSFRFNTMIIGDPDKCVEDMRHWVKIDEPGFWDALTTEQMVRKQPFRRLDIPGKKKAREKVSTDQLEVGGTQEPVFGKPETGKKPRKGRK